MGNYWGILKDYLVTILKHFLERFLDHVGIKLAPVDDPVVITLVPLGGQLSFVIAL